MLRLRRALSWLDRAEQEIEDSDAAFIFYWIAFNAAYAEDKPENSETTTRERFRTFIHQVVSLDAPASIYDELWTRFSGAHRVLMENRYVFEPFWKHQNGVTGYEQWEQWFERDKQNTHKALKDGDTETVLKVLFDRLYVLRNQLVHGGATWNGSVNRAQVRDGANIMAFLTPRFIALMMDNPQRDWGPPYYPVV